ncbi:bifunctional glutamate N-acetyltransferase/amino-acid acetyltransferase ArgJ [Methylicorpusculum sp.]|uniref:bifunctional glutamate N-acetyltransferase/amino-acid acetyltransferase ArgJ n=1 Tax=Methylicorpusculum sp. TaxID=2713644 RepID=UPI0027302401|nr:bifunctional glutamate N-acetyltransferase/amino-acid acetyltransferase ArgJ [Methylicorpusculum sp.]MDP2177598.1 bifunctional glutamate N-acetyltransferase/amino-acid acetyltransferase ArgJ [Methylicorpusculum sp.]MDP3531504.1 bifunctional glutamate N-acetyltransferase/amino-acid acetyltransferase ArgJ [Methylicorpusculum sp.]MDZ4153478.1 bifunctional glutamate N-acetyltransferase/amino-acid acetyltransferase ArgJ [Methylicorpusculum sp.]
MAVGALPFPLMHPVAGITLGTTCAGIKQTVRDDLLVVEMATDSTCAAVFTQNAFCAAPVHVAKAHLSKSPRWLLINSGNANAGTGASGMENALSSCAGLAKWVNGEADQVLPFSTGVIGEPLRVDKIQAALPSAVKDLSIDHWEKAARAIMTTDTFAKGASKIIEIEGKSITISGISKGAGMIQPNMATMLAFIATDAKIAQPLLQECLTEATEQSFNRITVDGDTSTNDACVLMASGASETPELQAGTPAYKVFSQAVLAICKELAEAIVRDGEGATKLMRIVVTSAASDEEAVRVGKTIAHSPLVKTAFFASDPNWGRILAAVGRSGIDNMALEAVDIYLGDVCIVKAGERATGYTEAAGQHVMNQEEISVTVSLGRGQARQEILTCDFSYDYVKINAEYRT